MYSFARIHLIFIGYRIVHQVVIDNNIISVMEILLEVFMFGNSPTYGSVYACRLQ
jgi:hypothetical protein